MRLDEAESEAPEDRRRRAEIVRAGGFAGDRDRPCVQRRTARIAVPEYRHRAEADIDAELAALRRGGRAVAEAAARSSRASRRCCPASAAEEVGYLLDAHLAMLSNSRLVRGVERRIGRRPDQRRARRARSRSTRSPRVSRRWATPISPRGSRISASSARGSIRNLTKTPYAAYPGHARRHRDPRRGADPGRHRADGSAPHRRLCAPSWAAPRAIPRSWRARSSLPAVLGVAGSARTRVEPGDRCVIDGGAGIIVIDPTAGDDRALRGASATRLERERRRLGALAPAAGGDPRRRRDHARGQSRIAARARPGDGQRRRMGSASCAPSSST